MNVVWQIEAAEIGPYIWLYSAKDIVLKYVRNLR
jgi:hypothetical protein